MPTQFYLKDPQRGTPAKDQRATPIVLVYHFDGYRMKLGVGESIDPAQWSAAKQRARTTHTGAANLNKFLDRMADRVRETHLALKSEFTVVTPDTLRRAIQRDVLSRGQRETVVTYLDLLIAERRANDTTKSYQVWENVSKLLKEYPGSVNFNDVTPEWFARLQAWMENYRSKVIPDGYAPNYIGKVASVIRQIMRKARKAGLHRSSAFEDEEYTPPRSDTDAIYLTVDELIRMHRVELPEYLDNVRNRFLISAFTGLRFSDYSTITMQAVRDGLIHDVNQKTKTKTVIPIHWVVEEIFARHPDGLPRSVANRNANKDIKRIGELAGITAMVEHTKIRGGKTICKSVPKYTLITTHTGRRSACTNMDLAGVPRGAIMAISGHKKEASFLKYIRCTQEQSARSIQHHPFFIRVNGDTEQSTPPSPQ